LRASVSLPLYELPNRSLALTSARVMYIDASNLDRFSQDRIFGVLRRMRAETGVNARMPLSD
jgi:hypothetical protein